MSNPAPQKRKRAYRRRVTRSEYQDAHTRTKHIGKEIKCTVSRALYKSRLGFTGGDETITNVLKCSKIDAENVCSDLQNDGSTDVVHSSEFSNVVHILAVIPATSCSTERSFSALRR